MEVAARVGAADEELGAGEPIVVGAVGEELGAGEPAGVGLVVRSWVQENQARVRVSGEELGAGDL